MSGYTEAELSALRRAFAAGTLRVNYDGKNIEYGSADDLLRRIRTIEGELARGSRRRPVAGFATFRRGDR